MRISMMMAVSTGLAMVLSACGGGSGGTGTGGGSSTSATGTSSSTSTGSTMNGTGGSTSSTGTGSCTPKTCLTLAVEMAADAGVNDPMPDACGILSDGCANFIDCMSCDNPDQACGANYPNDHGGGPTDQGVPNLCGGGCTLQQSENGFCSMWPGYKSLYICTNKTLMVPKSLVPQCQAFGVPGQPTNVWCCP